MEPFDASIIDEMKAKHPWKIELVEFGDLSDLQSAIASHHLNGHSIALIVSMCRAALADEYLSFALDVVKSGCRRIYIAGPGRYLFEDCIDEVDAERFTDTSPEDPVLTIASPDNESLADIFWQLEGGLDDKGIVVIAIQSSPQ